MGFRKVNEDDILSDLLSCREDYLLGMEAYLVSFQAWHVVEQYVSAQVGAETEG